MTREIMNFFKIKETKMINPVDDIEEIEIDDDVKEAPLPPPPPVPPPPPTSDVLLKDWFIMLSHDLNMNKFIEYEHEYFFGSRADKSEYPMMDFRGMNSDGRPRLIYKEYNIYITKDEALRLSKIFKDGFDAYYSNVFINKMNELKRKAKPTKPSSTPSWRDSSIKKPRLK